MTEITNDLLHRIEGFLDRHPEMKPSALGLAAVNDGHIVHKLRRGGNTSLRTADRLCAFMAAYETGNHEARKSA